MVISFSICLVILFKLADKIIEAVTYKRVITIEKIAAKLRLKFLKTPLKASLIPVLNSLSIFMSFICSFLFIVY